MMDGPKQKVQPVKNRLLVFVALLVMVIGAITVVLVRHHSGNVSMIIKNADIYTVNPSLPKAEAMAIEDGRIVGIGTSADILRRFVADTVIDLGGRPIYPGFIDSHAHLEGLGQSLSELNLSECRHPEEIASKVGLRAAATKRDLWIRGRGWDQNLWTSHRFPEHALLDRAASQNPVVLVRIDGHAMWVNRLALVAAGIEKTTPDPVGGKIVRDANGEPTGILIDKAMNLINAVVPPTPIEERRETVRRAMKECVAFGLTEVHDMGVDSEMVAIYRGMLSQHALPIRVYAAIDGTGSFWQSCLHSGPDKGDRNARLVVRALKIYMDGALGSRGAALLEPYSDDPGNRGLTLLTSDSLVQIAKQCLDNGFQLCVHAIGDRANATVLASYEKAFQERKGGPDARFRIEHAQIIDPPDFRKFHTIGVLPMMQPTHCTSDMPWAGDRLGKKRLEGAYAWRTLIDEGNIVPAGSDFPVESPNPLLGFYAAITRQTTTGYPPEGWAPDQRMTRDEALKAFTIWGAYAAFQEDLKGSLEVGKLADLVVLSDDIMVVDPSHIPSVTVEATMIGGEFVLNHLGSQGGHE